MNSASISTFAALAGAAIGGLTSFATSLAYRFGLNRTGSSGVEWEGPSTKHHQISIPVPTKRC